MSKKAPKITTFDELAVAMNRGLAETQKHLDTRLDTRIDDLAVMINRGFTEVHERMATKDELKAVVDELTATHDDVRYFRNTVSRLGQSDVA